MMLNMILMLFVINILILIMSAAILNILFIDVFYRLFLMHIIGVIIMLMLLFNLS